MNSVQDFNGKSYAVVGPKSSKQWKSLRGNDISGFLCFLTVKNLKKCEKTMKVQGPFNVTHKGKTVIFIKF